METVYLCGCVRQDVFLRAWAFFLSCVWFQKKTWSSFIPRCVYSLLVDWSSYAGNDKLVASRESCPHSSWIRTDTLLFFFSFSLSAFFFWWINYFAGTPEAVFPHVFRSVGSCPVSLRDAGCHASCPPLLQILQGQSLGHAAQHNRSSHNTHTRPRSWGAVLGLKFVLICIIFMSFLG